jgi:hypothetical protein
MCRRRRLAEENTCRPLNSTALADALTRSRCVCQFCFR